MTKQEIIEAINSTIVANGQKGITAESLNNILNEMVNATPEGGSGEGSGDGLLKVYAPDEMFLEEFISIGGFSTTNWATIKESYSGIGFPEDLLNDYDEIVREYQAANATAYQTIYAKMQNKEGVACFIDASKTTGWVMRLLLALEGDSPEDYPMTYGVVAFVFGAPDLGINVIPIDDSDGAFVPMILHEDGSISFRQGSKLSIPLKDATLSEEKIASNVAFATEAYELVLGINDIKIYCYGDNGYVSNTTINLLSKKSSANSFEATYFEDTTLKKIIIDIQAGTTTVITLGTLTA